MALQLLPRRWSKCCSHLSSTIRAGSTSTKPPKSLLRGHLSDDVPVRASTANLTNTSLRGANRIYLGDIKHSLEPIEKDRLREAELGPLSDEDKQTERRLSLPASNPARILRECISNGTASIHVVRLCIIAQYREVAQAPRVKQPKVAAAQDRIASLALAHLLSDVNLWAPFVMCCTNAMFALSYYSIVDGLGDEVFFNWMSTEIPTQFARSSAWRNVILRSMIGAKFAYDSGQSKDKVIQCFLDAHSLQQKAQISYNEQLDRDTNTRKRPILYLSLYPAWIELVSLLSNGFTRDTNPKLYDRLLSVIRLPGVFKGTQSELENNIAHILLYYPGRPQEANAVRILRNFAAGDLEALPSRVTTPNGEKVFKRFLQRTVDLLSINGKVEDRDWVMRKFEVFLDPTTGKFAALTYVDRTESNVSTARRQSSPRRHPTTPVPFPIFT